MCRSRKGDAGAGSDWRPKELAAAVCRSELVRLTPGPKGAVENVVMVRAMRAAGRRLYAAEYLQLLWLPGAELSTRNRWRWAQPLTPPAGRFAVIQ